MSLRFAPERDSVGIVFFFLLSCVVTNKYYISNFLQDIITFDKQL